MASMVITFGLLALVVIIAAHFLALYADRLAVQTGLGGGITGLVLLAGATSLPEFSIGFNAVRIGAVDLTAGDVLGSSLINLLILAMLDLTSHRPGNILTRKAAAHALSATVACIMTAIVLLGILLDSSVSFLRIGPCSWGLLLTYALCARMLYLDQKTSMPPEAKNNEPSVPHSLLFNATGFITAAAVIFFVAPYLAETADELASVTGLGRTFFGTVFVALMTSLPEAVSTLSAVRLGTIDMAIGNILGSNAFNMLVLAVLDISAPQPILSLVSDVNAVTAACVIIITGVATLSMLYRAEKRFWLVEPDAAIVALLIVGALYLVYISSH
jgi:cation:H+ antiporter